MMAGHIVPRKIYFAVFLALMALTAVTVWVSTMDLGPLNIAVALAIAVGKATLVLLYFMHLRYSPRLTWLVVGAGFVWLAILIAFTMSDVLTRSLLSFTS